MVLPWFFQVFGVGSPFLLFDSSVAGSRKSSPSRQRAALEKYNRLYLYPENIQKRLLFASFCAKSGHFESFLKFLVCSAAHSYPVNAVFLYSFFQEKLMMPATVADLIAYLKLFPASQLVMLEAHPGGLIPIQTIQVMPAALGYFAEPRKMPGMIGRQTMIEWGWGPHCPISYARDPQRAADTPVLVLGCVRPGNPLVPAQPRRIDPEAIEADMRCFLNDSD
jgi:hypothetical protein